MIDIIHCLYPYFLFYHLPNFLSQLSAVTRRHFGQAEAEEPEISKAWRSSWSFNRPLV